MSAQVIEAKIVRYLEATALVQWMFDYWALTVGVCVFALSMLVMAKIASKKS
jgi:hypothetical protein